MWMERHWQLAALTSRNHLFVFSLCKYILGFRQIHFAIWENTFYNLEREQCKQLCQPASRSHLFV